LHFLENDEKYNYTEFDELSNKLAKGLHTADVAQGDSIACCWIAMQIPSPY